MYLPHRWRLFAWNLRGLSVPSEHIGICQGIHSRGSGPVTSYGCLGRSCRVWRREATAHGAPRLCYDRCQVIQDASASCLKPTVCASREPSIRGGDGLSTSVDPPRGGCGGTPKAASPAPKASFRQVYGDYARPSGHLITSPAVAFQNLGTVWWPHQDDTLGAVCREALEKSS